MSNNGLSLHAAGSVVFAAGAPSWLWQNGKFTGTITDTAQGDVSVNLQADQGVDAEESVVLVTARAAQAASGATAFGVVHTSDTAKQITTVQETAAGGASARADVNFDVLILKRELV